MNQSTNDKKSPPGSPATDLTQSLSARKFNDDRNFQLRISQVSQISQSSQSQSQSQNGQKALAKDQQNGVVILKGTLESPCGSPVHFSGQISPSKKFVCQESFPMATQGGEVFTEANEESNLCPHEEGETSSGNKKESVKTSQDEEKKKGYYPKMEDLLPEGIKSIDELKIIYEEQRNLKKKKYLNRFPKDDILDVAFIPGCRFVVVGCKDRSIRIFDVKTKQEVDQILEAHFGEVRAVAVTSDCKFLVSGSDENDKSIKVFDLVTKKSVHTFERAHDKAISCLTISPDNRYIVSGSEDRSIKLWSFDREKKEEHCWPARHQTPIQALIITPDNKSIISSSLDPNIAVFNISDKLFKYIFKGTSHVASIALTPDNMIVSGLQDQTIKLQSLSTEVEESFPKDQINGNISAVAVSQDDNFIFAGLENGDIIMLNRKTKKKVKHFKKVLKNKIDRIIVSQDDDFLISCSKGGKMKMTQLKQKKKPYTHLEKVHDGAAITSIGCFSDNDHIVSVGSDGTLKVFEIESRQLFSIFDKSAEEIVSFAIIPKSTFLAFGSKNGIIVMLDFKNQEEHFRYSLESQESIVSLAVTSDKKTIVAATDKKSLIIFDVLNKKVAILREAVHEKHISNITITPDDQFIVSCSEDKSIKIWNIVTGKEVYHFKDVHSDEVLAVAVTPNGKFIVSASKDFSIDIIDIKTKNLIHQIKYAHDSAIHMLSISSDSKFIASGSANKSIKIFDIETRNLVHSIPHAHHASIRSIAFLPNMNHIVSGDADGCMHIFEFETCMKTDSINSNLDNEYLTAVAVSPDNQFFVSGSDSGVLDIYDMKTRANTLSLGSPNYEKSILKSQSLRSQGSQTKNSEKNTKKRDQEIKSIAITPDNNIVFGSADGSVRVIDKREEKQIKVFKEHKDAVYAVAVTLDNQYIISGSKDRSLKVMEIRNEQRVYSVDEIHQDTIRSIAVTPDSKYIVSGSADRSIKILSIQAILNKSFQKEIYHFKGAHSRWIKCVAVSRDGKYIVSGSDGRSIRIFDIQSKQVVHRFKHVHEDYVETVAISDDCKYIISGSKDKSIKVFDIQTKQQIHHFKNAHEGRIKSLAVTSNNKYIISVSDDSHINIHRMSPATPQGRNSKSLLGKFIEKFSLQERKKTMNDLQMLNSETYFVYNGLFNYPNFNAVDDFLFNSEMPVRTIIQSAVRSQQLTLFPYAWSILHLAAIKAHPTFIKNMPQYANFKVPFLLDIFNRTPLHYLLAHKEFDAHSVNIMLTYICDYLDDSKQCEAPQVKEIVISLTPLLPFILTRTELKAQKRFLQVCFIDLPLPYGRELPRFGKPANKAGSFVESLDSIGDSKADTTSLIKGMIKGVTESRIKQFFKALIKQSSKYLVSEPPKGNDILENDSILTKGTDQIEIKANLLKLDYDVKSQEMDDIIDCLREQKNEETFEIPLVFKLIDHLWEQTKKFLILTCVVFSLYILALSVYLSREDTDLPYEIVILSFSGFFAYIEVLQIFKARMDYLSDIWNWIDILLHPLTIVYIILRRLGLENDTTRAWISTMIILFGYIRLTSYLRIFKPTRNLIQVILTVVKDMWSFIAILALIIIGFSFIFLVFGRGRLYGYYLYNAYGSLYGPVDDGDSSDSEKFFIALIAFLLNVILLNLLISIMGTSYDKVLEKRVMTDCLTRLDLISDSVVLLKLLKEKKTQKQGFLIFCLSLDDPEDDEKEESIDWEEKIESLRNDLKQSLDENERRMEQRIVALENKQSQNMHRMETLLEKISQQIDLKQQPSMIDLKK